MILKRVLLLLTALPYVILAEGHWPENSIYQLKSEWVRHDGKKIKLEGLAGRPQIVSMVFLRCQYSCPITVQDMKSMEKLILEKNKKASNDFGLVLISIDPDHDSPEEMIAHAKKRGLDLSRWTLITSKPENIRELAAVLGFNYRKDEAMEFAHSMLTWVMDKNGVIEKTRVGQKETTNEIASEVSKLIKK